MAVNESIYGLKATWRTDNFSENNSDDLKHYSANFGNNSGQILYAIRNNKLKVNTPWDKSICYAAMDNGSVFSKVTFCASNGTNAPNVLTTENNALTEFNIGITNRNPYTNKQYNILKDKSYYTTMFWASNSTATDGTSTDREFCPSTSIAFKNMVLVPYVLATSSNTPPIADNDKICVPLKDYIDTYTLTHPYIVRVIVSFYGKTFANLTRTSIAKGIPTVAILNQLPKLCAKLNDINESTPDVRPFYTYTMCRGFIGGGSGLRNVARGINLFGECQTDTDVDVWGYSTNAYLDTDTSSNHYMSAWLNYNKYVHVKNPEYPKKIFSYIPYYNDFYEDVMTQTAYFGMFFTPDVDVAVNGDLNDNAMYCGIIDDSGITHGQYYHGAQNELLKQYSEWSNTNDTPYKSGGTDPNTYRNTSGFNNVINAPRDFNKRYVLSGSDVNTLNADFFAALSGVQTSEILDKAMEKFYVNNPIDCIVSLKWFPFSLPTFGSAQTVKLGVYNTTVSANQYVGSGVEVHNLGECLIYPHFGMGVFGGSGPCFLDYEPYTHIELIVPYCGTVKISPSDFMNCTLRVMMTVDVYSGSCTAYIQRNGLTVDSISGTISVDLPVSGVEAATLDSQVHTATNNFKMAKVQEAMTVVSSALRVATNFDTSKGQMISISGGANALADAVMSTAVASENLANTKYDLEHINVPFKTVGSNSGLNGAKAEQFCSLNITRPVLHSGFNADTYGHTVGYACLENGLLSSFTGYTVVSDIDLTGVNATADEKNMIINTLKGGVYL